MWNSDVKRCGKNSNPMWNSDVKRCRKNSSPMWNSDVKRCGKISNSDEKKCRIRCRKILNSDEKKRRIRCGKIFKSDVKIRCADVSFLGLHHEIVQHKFLHDLLIISDTQAACLNLEAEVFCRFKCVKKSSSPSELSQGKFPDLFWRRSGSTARLVCMRNSETQLRFFSVRNNRST